MAGGSKEFERTWKSRPHVILLGAGASRAALPEGDANGRKLPLINDFIQVVGLDSLLDEMGIQYEERNIESLYAELAKSDTNQLARVEKAISDYFGSLRLPDYPTIYDYIVLSVTERDLLATFNWDPFLVQAIRRNLPALADVPPFAFLHGNTMIGYCKEHKIIGPLDSPCSECGEMRWPSKLLYPITQKDYATDELIADQWNRFRFNLGRAAVFTVFGYSAPSSDAEAMDAIRTAWGTSEQRQFEQFEIIDIRKEEEVLTSWNGLIHSHHYAVVDDYFESWLAKHPGESIDMYVSQFLMAQFIGDNPAPRDVSFEELWNWFSRRRAEIQRTEG